jgi:hypothetical protein
MSLLLTSNNEVIIDPILLCQFSLLLQNSTDEGPTAPTNLAVVKPHGLVKSSFHHILDFDSLCRTSFKPATTSGEPVCAHWMSLLLRI